MRQLLITPDPAEKQVWQEPAGLQIIVVSGGYLGVNVPVHGQQKKQSCRQAKVK